VLQIGNRSAARYSILRPFPASSAATPRRPPICSSIAANGLDSSCWSSARAAVPRIKPRKRKTSKARIPDFRKDREILAIALVLSFSVRWISCTRLGGVRGSRQSGRRFLGRPRQNRTGRRFGVSALIPISRKRSVPIFFFVPPWGLHRLVETFQPPPHSAHPVASIDVERLSDHIVTVA
jgi:hypothetical protein